jgi:hypothetical protein
MLCQYWDGQRPEGLSVVYNNGWMNESQTITLRAMDRGGSRLKRIVLQEMQNTGGWVQVGDWDNLNANILVERTFTRTPVENATFRYRMYAYDTA